MVGRFVEEKEVGDLVGEPGEHHSALLTVGELLDGGGLSFSSDAITTCRQDTIS